MKDFAVSKHGKGKQTKYFYIAAGIYKEITQSQYYRYCKQLENLRFA